MIRLLRLRAELRAPLRIVYYLGRGVVTVDNNSSSHFSMKKDIRRSLKTRKFFPRVLFLKPWGYLTTLEISIGRRSLTFTFCSDSQALIIS